MTELTRDEQLVRASRGRAAIVGFLNQRETPEPATQDSIMTVVESLGYTPTELSNMLYRMADDGLIVKHHVDHERYRVGYTAVSGAGAEEVRTKRPYTKRQPAVTEGTPIDVRVNDQTGTITIRYAGMVISFSKEQG